MKLHYHKSPLNNFGDVLNPWFWNKVFGDEWQSKGNINEIAVGIGTLINESLDSDNRYHILGSGVGYGTTIPKNRNKWSIHCVRGPLSAKALGVEKSLAISDPAILISDFVKFESNVKKYNYSFMPHVDIDSYRYQLVCEEIGINYISPKWSMTRVLDNIHQSEKLLCSAMHGAILADTLRVPWLPVITAEDILPFKWEDWCLSMELDYKPFRLTPLWEHAEVTMSSKLKTSLKNMIAKNQLNKLKNSKYFVLSDSLIINSKKERLKEVFHEFQSKELKYP
ncbi:polysaccharide pyruvyl transferase family protein [Colwellia sp. BRX8-9]|uniref:polysaccharide pyruvyl transferase family protein n=1 Tax=Colwellia sp. BRX8-9 TaxID=2759831 RepID=UPI0015F47164|nr:polysaccharide pyruvyl transferase family protein [Colwellia sp. BRX8-9]MBA6348686.1 polysaccharide pyruvyl transferase family protein [Colwellia sp. BRX8-9]